MCPVKSTINVGKIMHVQSDDDKSGQLTHFACYYDNSVVKKIRHAIMHYER